jgi:hypothetical protein
MKTRRAFLGSLPILAVAGGSTGRALWGADQPDPAAPAGVLALELIAATKGLVVVALENVGKTSIFLNLGIIVGGGWLCPEQLRLVVTDGRGASRTLHYPLRTDDGSIVPAINGRVDDFVLPLMAGAKYAMTFPIGHFVDREIKSGVVAGDKLQAVFEGKKPSHANVGSVAGFIPGLPFWTGRVESASRTYTG